MLPYETNNWKEEIVRCKNCKYHNLIADTFPEKSMCKNIDYTKYWIYAPWFSSHCTGEGILPCRYFEPESCYVYLNKHWTNIDDYMAWQIMQGYVDFHKSKLSLFMAKDRNKSYTIYFRDFYYGTYENIDGTLKHAYVQYYKRNKNSAIGYNLITEHTKQSLVIENKTYLDTLQEIHNKVYIYYYCF